MTVLDMLKHGSIMDVIKILCVFTYSHRFTVGFSNACLWHAVLQRLFVELLLKEGNRAIKHFQYSYTRCYI